MRPHRRRTGARFTAGPVALLLVVLASGCDDPDSCAPHGWLHDDHCHCSRGYQAEGRSCVPKPDAAVEADGSPGDALDAGDPDAGATADAGDAATCRDDGPCTSDAECCDYCHVDHCH